MLKQLSIFTENKKGAMQKITQVLADENINILGSVTNDSAEYGIVRMVVSETQKAFEALQNKGYMCQITDVIGIETEDAPGNMNGLLIALAESNINVQYIYLSYKRSSKQPVLIFCAEDASEVEACMNSQGFRPVADML